MSTQHPGTVRSDQKAFQQIEARFRDEVGRILANVDFENGPAPFWSLLRVMFPVAESLGDLMYRKDTTAENLWSVLENDFGRVRRAYSGKAALLAQLFRHSLIHHDELRILKSGGRELVWMINGENDGKHLFVSQVESGSFYLLFQPRAFYDDILQVCDQASRRRWGGAVVQRYNSWMSLDLDFSRSTRSVRAARSELANL